jgi:hypothetical protein
MIKRKKEEIHEQKNAVQNAGHETDHVHIEAISKSREIID